MKLLLLVIWWQWKNFNSWGIIVIVQLFFYYWDILLLHSTKMFVFKRKWSCELFCTIYCNYLRGEQLSIEKILKPVNLEGTKFSVDNRNYNSYREHRHLNLILMTMIYETDSPLLLDYFKNVKHNLELNTVYNNYGAICNIIIFLKT